MAEFGAGTFPDGFEFDAEGGIWIASVVSNRLLRIAPDGAQTVVLEDSDPEVVAAVERKYQESGLARADIDAGRDRTLGNLASVAFGGPDLQDGLPRLAVRAADRDLPLADRRRRAAALALLTGRRTDLPGDTSCQGRKKSP